MIGKYLKKSRNGRNRAFYLSEHLVQFFYKTYEIFNLHYYVLRISSHLASWKFYRGKSDNLYEHLENISFVSVCTSCNGKNMKYNK